MRKLKSGERLLRGPRAPDNLSLSKLERGIHVGIQCRAVSGSGWSIELSKKEARDLVDALTQLLASNPDEWK